MTAYDRGNIIPFPRQGEVRIYRLRIELLLVPEPIWREILVPDQMDFWELHVAIQDAMGWEDAHLHLFVVDDPEAGERRRIGIPDDSEFHGVSAILPGWDCHISDYLRVGGHPMLYTYDFGDDWRHEVSLVEIQPDEAGTILPRCVGGSGLCPEENSGGAAMMAPDIRPDDPVFEPQAVVFENPQQRWRRMFEKD